MTKSIATVRTDMEIEFIGRLFILLELYRAGNLRMHFNDQDLGFAKNDTYSPLTVAQSSYHPLDMIDDKSVIVYVTSSEAGFGLLDTDKETALPITISELTHAWVDENNQFQRDKLTNVRIELDIILEESGLHQ